MVRHYYSDSISAFIETPVEVIVGALSHNSDFSVENNQIDAWVTEISILKSSLTEFSGSVFFEYNIPRMGRRIDVILIISSVILILEFKVGEKEYRQSALDQVWDYALDLKNFHETSTDHLIAPVLIATGAKNLVTNISTTSHNDDLLLPIRANRENLRDVIKEVINYSIGDIIDTTTWAFGRYSPTPTIIEAAMALYNGHSVAEISRNDSTAINLSQTSNAVNNIILNSKENKKKAICFLTGVPGAGKTLVGLNIATKNFDKELGLTSVFLSGNGPLVAVLREALTRDKVRRIKESGQKKRKGEVLSEVKLFIQNVHHFRDECLINEFEPPFDHIAVFDEAQRAWDKTQTQNFMIRKKGKTEFHLSEPEFLISCLDRHKDWAVVVCLVGGGQEINTGEAGISEWIESINRSFPEWNVYISNRLLDSEYAAGRSLELIRSHKYVSELSELHLSVSLRSFRAENLSFFIKSLLDLDVINSKSHYLELKDHYPIVLTRSVSKAKSWLRSMARGSERFGMVVSSQAQRLKPFSIDVKSPMDPIHWFLDEKDDVRSSYYLEDVATEFHVQGLELDWACITWDADFRYSHIGWEHYSFVGTKWNNIKKEERKLYQKNAYRVLLTRARQGMIIVVPEGDTEDQTRDPKFYDKTFNYLLSLGLDLI